MCLWLHHQCTDVLLEAERAGGRGKAFHRHTIGVAQELGEVPLEAVAQHPPGQRLHQILVKRIRLVLVVALYLAQHGVLSALTLGEALHLCVGAWLLTPKIIAGEGEDLQTLRRVLGVEGRHLCIILGRQASLARHIHDQVRLLALEGGQRDGLSRGAGHIEFEDGVGADRGLLHFVQEGQLQRARHAEQHKHRHQDKSVHGPGYQGQE
mmetsp:Transcript_14789/g.32643  ORF Transcript_14789/g.32643 Transcript_14789/m.32643 type:complete len:209 (+) Transcript_14789:368-994(+)